MDSMAIGLSGVRSASVHVAASAHNVANLLTPAFRPLRVVQTTAPGGGSEARAVQEPDPRPVDLPREIVGQMQAGLQFRASLRVIETSESTTGRLIDLFA